MADHRPVRLSPLAAKHASGLHAIVSDPRVALPVGLPVPAPPRLARDFIRARTVASCLGTASSFAIEAAGIDDLIGVCSLFDIDPRGGRAELAFFVARAWSGRGYGTSAVLQLMELAAQSFELRELVGRCRPDNVRARRILLRAGFRELAAEASEIVKYTANFPTKA
jgi:ribosomal-protein-alanine N-acetyltransferase